MRPISQFRFVQTTMTSGRPCLSPEIKYLAMYSMDDGRLTVLAQVRSGVLAIMTNN
jgi:hypothetical protein